jgi:hypothetical protein
MMAVVDAPGQLLGGITDGDPWRQLRRHGRTTATRAGEIMMPQPQWIGRQELAAKAVQSVG